MWSSVRSAAGKCCLQYEWLIVVEIFLIIVGLTGFSYDIH